MFETQRVTLVKEKVATCLNVDSAMFHNLEVDFLAGEISDSMLFRLKAYVYRNKDIETITHKEPTNWWEHFKRDLMPKWFTDKFPVKTKEYKWEIRQIWSGVPDSMFPNREIIYQVASYNPNSWHD